MRSIRVLSVLFVLFASFCIIHPVHSYPLQFVDDQGNRVTISDTPQRVVSLVPAVTEIIVDIGAADALKGVTWHDGSVAGMAIPIVGGFFSPSAERIRTIGPDVIFYSDVHRDLVEQLAGSSQLICLAMDSVENAFADIQLLGRIFDKEAAASDLVAGIRQQFQIIRQKVDKIPAADRKRVIRLMGTDAVMTPGDDSFQNEMIRAAGGIPPELGKHGAIVAVTQDEWLRFNPQVIFGCGEDRKTAAGLFARPGWRDVDAVKTGAIHYFPCDLTCRASGRTGDFVSWLSSQLYVNEFFATENQVLKDQVLSTRPLEIGLDYIKAAQIAYSTIHDFTNKTLIIDFKQPMTVVSTLEGTRQGITTVGNHYSSPPCWGIEHKLGLAAARPVVYSVIGKSSDTSSFLFTGADMDHLAVKSRTFKDMTVYALVTAGVQSNAVRMSKDTGNYYEPGTINMILMSNMKLTERAMTRAIISATEAKTAALMDMDIRSTYGPVRYQATGTGTDNMIIVQGDGVKIDNAGGHSKMGELIATAVYDAVQEAVLRQNGLTSRRNVFQRLQERNISLFGMKPGETCDCIRNTYEVVSALEQVLLEPRYADFIETAFAVSDDYENGLITDLSAYEIWCGEMAQEIAGGGLKEMKDVIKDEQMPAVMRMALNALLNGTLCAMNTGNGP